MGSARVSVFRVLGFVIKRTTRETVVLVPARLRLHAVLDGTTGLGPTPSAEANCLKSHVAEVPRCGAPASMALFDNSWLLWDPA